MLYLRSWLEEYIDLKEISNQKLSHLISIKSGEVEEYKEITDWFEGKVLVGRIENVTKHPNADRLKMFDVNLGSKGFVKIVSAAPNVVEGMLVPTATIGAKLAYLTIAERQMRGEKSEGMCMGKSELMLETEYSSGLWDLTTEIPQAFHDQVLGMSICEVLPEYFPAQTVFDIKYLPDKIGFLGCHMALAIELDLILEGEAALKPKAKRLLNTDTFWEEFQNQALKITSNNSKNAKFEDKTGYTNVFSLFDLELENEFNLNLEFQQRLFFTGKNLIGGLADLSNYLLYDVGQPSHFFNDAQNQFSWDWEVKKLSSPLEFVGLGKLIKAELPTGLKVIEDGQNVVWIPGISGSSSTRIKPEDTKISIELANFKTEEVARNSFKLNYRSESCRFWNSGVSVPVYLVWLLHFLESLELDNTKFDLANILTWLNPNHDLAKFEQNNSGYLGFCHRLLETKNIGILEIDKQYLVRRIHPDFEQKVLDKYLQKVGNLEGNKLTPNIFYSNLKTQEDVLFEVARLFGLQNVEHENLPTFSNKIENIDYNSLFLLKKLISEFGFNEVILRPLVNPKNLLSSLTELGDIALTAISTQRQDENRLRDSLLPSLLEITSINQKRGEKEIKIFEMDKIYTYPNGKLVEDLKIGLILESEKPYVLTTLINQISRFSKTVNMGYDQVEESFGKGFLYTLDCGLNLKLLQISNKYKKNYDINLAKAIWYLEIDLNNWNKVSWNYKSYKDESDFPVVNRSYSLIVSNKDTLDGIKNLILQNKIDQVEIEINPVERFSLDENLEVLNLDLVFSSNFKTINSEIISSWQADLEKLLAKNLHHFAWR